MAFSTNRKRNAILELQSAVDTTASTLTVTALDHNGHVIVFNAAAGTTATLPAATGSAAEYNFYVTTTVTSNDYIIQVANSTDIIQGQAWVSQDAADTVVAFEAGASDDTITMNGTTTGGLKGAKITLVDVASGEWSVQMFGAATGTEATPFSAAV